MISKKIKEFHANSEPEKESAQRLANSLEPWRFLVPNGPILEAGAGTGNFTDYLIRIFPKRKVIITDRSEEMINFHRERFKGNDQLDWQVVDLEKEVPDDQSFAMICGNHVAHQFRHPAIALEKLSMALKIHGLMLMGYIGNDSFKEWRSACLDLGLPYTGKTLPGTEPLVIHLSKGPFQVDIYEDQSKVYFDSFHYFLKHCENGGWSAQNEKRVLNQDEINLLNENWKDRKNGKIGMTYHNVFLAAKRIAE